MKNFMVISIFLLLFSPAARADEIRTIDSLVRLLPTLKQDTERVNTLNRIAWQYEENGDFDVALGYCSQALSLGDSLGYKRGLSTTYNIFAIISKERGEYPESIDYQLKSLKLKEELGDMGGVATAYINIGNVYFNQKKFPEALNYYYTALRIGQKHQLPKTIATSHGNLGIVFNSEKKLDSAAYHYERCLSIRTGLNDRAGMSACYANIGILHWDQGKLDQALDYMFKAAKISEELNNKVHVVINKINIGEVYIDKMELDKGIGIITEGMDLAKAMRLREKLVACYQALSGAFKLKGDYQKALDYYDLYVVTRDSMINEKNNKSIAEMQAKYATDKKQREIELLRKDNNISMLNLSEQNADASRRQIAVWSFAAMGVLLLALTFFVWKGFLQKRRANLLLSEKNHSITVQKELIEEKNVQISSSIEFARRIQETILPASELLRSNLGEHFVLFMPKDVVSGDFYWLLPGSVPLLAVADCTGHGVPGALMSLHGHDMLEKVSREKNVRTPALLLDELNQAIMSSITVHGGEQAEKFGMDMGVIALDRTKMELHYSGARNPLYLVRNGQLAEIKADRVSVGSATEKFNNQTVSLQKGDMIYLFSDGYADQIGGPNRKKYLSGNFKTLLAQIAGDEANTQRQKLLDLHVQWKGNFTQTDDVLVVGVRF